MTSYPTTTSHSHIVTSCPLYVYMFQFLQHFIKYTVYTWRRRPGLCPLFLVSQAGCDYHHPPSHSTAATLLLKWLQWCMPFSLHTVWSHNRWSQATSRNLKISHQLWFKWCSSGIRIIVYWAIITNWNMKQCWFTPSPLGFLTFMQS